MVHISDTDECRRLARNVVSADFSDLQIESYQDKEYSYIATLTDKDDWDIFDREYGALQLVETNLVASDIIKHYGTQETIPMWEALRATGLADLKMLVDNLDTPTEDSEFAVERTEFKGWGLNSSIEAPNRLTGAVDDTEGF